MRVLLGCANEVPVATLQGKTVGDLREGGNDIHDRLIDRVEIQCLESVLAVFRVSVVLQERSRGGERFQIVLGLVFGLTGS